MQFSKIVRPVNSLIFVSDREGGDVPLWVEGKLILSTNSCISVRCYPEQDGPTKVTLGAAREVASVAPPDFDGTLKTPTQYVVVRTVTHETILEMSVAELNTRVRIWLSHPRWPDKVVIGLD